MGRKGRASGPPVVVAVEVLQLLLSRVRDGLNGGEGRLGPRLARKMLRKRGAAELVRGIAAEVGAHQKKKTETKHQQSKNIQSMADSGGVSVW